MSQEFGVHDTCGVIGGLRVHREYQFSITATVVDIDGSVSESVRSRFIPVFVPGLFSLIIDSYCVKCAVCRAFGN